MRTVQADYPASHTIRELTTHLVPVHTPPQLSPVNISLSLSLSLFPPPLHFFSFFFLLRVLPLLSTESPHLPAFSPNVSWLHECRDATGDHQGHVSTSALPPSILYQRVRAIIMLCSQFVAQNLLGEKGLRKRERGRGRHRDRQTDRQSDRETERGLNN